MISDFPKGGSLKEGKIEVLAAHNHSSFCTAIRQTLLCPCYENPGVGEQCQTKVPVLEGFQSHGRMWEGSLKNKTSKPRKQVYMSSRKGPSLLDGKTGLRRASWVWVVGCL